MSDIEVITKANVKCFESLLKRQFEKCLGDDQNPWQTIEEISLKFVIRLRLDWLKDMELFLTLHLFVKCKLQMCDNIGQKMTFLDDLINWLPNIQFSDTNDVCLYLLWAQVVCFASRLYKDGQGSELLEKAEK